MSPMVKIMGAAKSAVIAPAIMGHGVLVSAALAKTGPTISETQKIRNTPMKAGNKHFVKNQIIRIAKKIFGMILIIGGILGLFLPFFQGIAMIILGSILLGDKFLIKKTKKLKKYFYHS